MPFLLHFLAKEGSFQTVMFAQLPFVNSTLPTYEVPLTKLEVSVSEYSHIKMNDMIPLG